MASHAPSPGSSSANPYLSRPASAADSSSSAGPSASSANESKHESRLYIGNLHPAVDEYTLIQTFAKFGKISKLDFLFHKSGPQRGQPRGYAFVEYASPQEAMQAVAGAHQKTLRGRSISVTFASKNADAGVGADHGGIGPHRLNRRAAANEADAVKTTQLSLSKNAKQPHGTNAKIAAMEAKLAKLRQVKAPAPSSPKGIGLGSLPAKPSFSAANDDSRRASSHRQQQRRQ
ncbi:RRM domain-containing protein [Pseudozyma hubeiensis]|nr:RRM domain-containing protein [Pseudozyma hubeiensis]